MPHMLAAGTQAGDEICGLGLEDIAANAISHEDDGDDDSGEENGDLNDDHPETEVLTRIPFGTKKKNHKI